MKKILLSAAVLMSAVSIQAIETPAEAPVVEHEMTLSGGTVSGQIKAMHIITDKDNNWTPNSGSGYLGTLKYETQEIVKGLKAGAAFYINGDTGLTDWGEYPVNSATDGTKPAQGMFTSVGGEENSHLGQAYTQYNNKNVDAKIGRMILNTPLTKIQWSLMPNFYEAYGLSTKSIPGLELSLTHINKMSYDIVNNIYADVDYKIPVMKGTKLSLSAQYLAQGEIGDKHAGEKDYSMYGAKARVGNKKWSIYAAYNQSDDSNAAFFNAWGADPAYTSSLFSRNAYRQDVGAYKLVDTIQL